jgi:hypothetical protein
MPRQKNLAVAGPGADSLIAWLEQHAHETAEPFNQAYRTFQICPPTKPECRMFWRRLGRIVDGRGTCLDALFLSIQPTFAALTGALVTNLNLLDPLMSHCPNAAEAMMGFATSDREARITRLNKKGASNQLDPKPACSIWRPCTDIDMNYFKKLLAYIFLDTSGMLVHEMAGVEPVLHERGMRLTQALDESFKEQIDPLYEKEIHFLITEGAHRVRSVVYGFRVEAKRTIFRTRTLEEEQLALLRLINWVDAHTLAGLEAVAMRAAGWLNLDYEKAREAVEEETAMQAYWEEVESVGTQELQFLVSARNAAILDRFGTLRREFEAVATATIEPNAAPGGDVDGALNDLVAAEVDSLDDDESVALLAVQREWNLAVAAMDVEYVNGTAVPWAERAAALQPKLNGTTNCNTDTSWILSWCKGLPSNLLHS